MAVRGQLNGSHRNRAIEVTETRTLFHAAAVVDAAGVRAAPGAILMEGSTVIAAGKPEEIGTPANTAIRKSSGVLIPALVNAHAHLDLTSLGLQPYQGDFVQWIGMIIKQRAAVTEQGIADSVRKGVEMSRRGGTALIGDIAGNSSPIPLQVQREAGLPGVSYFEVFGLTERQDAAIVRMQSVVDNTKAMERGVALGLSPHAPYTCGPRVYASAAKSGLPVCTHLAESPEELDFAASGAGPFGEFLRKLGIWSDAHTPLGSHPIEAVTNAVDNLSMLAAHLNYVSDHHLALLVERNVDVVYCPRASSYFRHTNHRYRDMLDAGVNVALGTDSILCLDTADRISVLDEMRLLAERDGTPAETLLRMTTVNGARALGFDDALFTFAPGASAGVLELEVGEASSTDALALLRAAIAKPQAPRWAHGPVGADVFVSAWRGPQRS